MHERSKGVKGPGSRVVWGTKDSPHATRRIIGSDAEDQGTDFFVG